MHVVVVTLNRGRGSGRVARDQVRALAAAGHRVSYVCAGSSPPVPGVAVIAVSLHSDVLPVHEYLPAAGSSQRRVSTMGADTAGRYRDDFVTALAGLDAPDVIIAHHATITAGAARAVAQELEIPYAVFVHGTGIEPRHYGGYDDAIWADIVTALTDSAGLMVTTEYVRDTLVRPLVEIPVDRFCLLPCGVDPERFATPDVAAVTAEYGLEEPYVICPGALTRLKGPQNVAAASRAYADLATTIFIGDGELAAQLTAELGARGRLLGYVPEDVKNALIAGATLLTAAPEKREHFGIVYVEAMAAGTVPVAYSGGGVDAIITPETGVLTDRNPPALGAAIRELLVDGERRHRMAAAARRRVAERFDTAILGPRFVAWVEATASR